ncbi:multidrug efflux SMR transporter [Pseudactinotalea sp. HY158]|uniref:DMT family transporter n=1 Tax=Pseudactinotalea sp. HY158 TaxID=2654547 RepID=UPI00129C4D94|nr:SMR family transporter [Pseudactinotalea sp. HY158]QGH68474.1 QacE family quaternary ammonium compound efflux SMR transporter [Pseudactinotalea sp. HY158]
MTALAWAFLVAGIVFEVAGTVALRLAIDRGRGWYAMVAVGYLLAFTLVSLALGEGMPLGVAYGIWTATGVALTAVLSMVLFREPLTRLMAVGIGLVAAGVLLIELGAR